MTTAPNPSDKPIKPKTGKPNPAAAAALLEDFYYWLLRSGRLAPRKRGARGKSVSVVTAKNS